MFRYRPWVFGYVMFMAVTTVGGCVVAVGSQDGWHLGDWLINYQAGFVRRGLPGEMMLRLAHALHLASPVLLVVAAQLICYGVMFFAVDRLLRPTKLSYWTLACVLSPATLAFQFLVWGGGYRKEILLLAGLSVLLLWLRREKISQAALVAYLCVLGVGCALSHEALVAYMPYVFAALVLGFGDTKAAAKVTAIPAVLTVVAAALTLHFRGDANTVIGVCRSLGYGATTGGTLPEMCGGAIKQLGLTSADGHADVLRYVHFAHFWPIYLTLTPVALLAPAMQLREDYRLARERHGVRVIAWCAVVAMATSLPLLWVATDWGRFIYIHVMCLFLLVLFLEWKRQTRDVASVVPQAEGTRVPAFAKYAFLLLYATTWILPFTGPLQWPWGYPQMAWLMVHKDAK